MRNILMSVLVAGSLLVSGSAGAKNAKNAKTATSSTWAMIRTGDAKLMAFVDRDAIATDGGATVVVTGTPTESVKTVTLDVELLYAKDGSDKRKVIRHTRQTIEVDQNTHAITIAIGERGRALDAYSVLVRVVDPGAEPDAVDSVIKTTHSTIDQVVLALGKR